MKLFGISTKQIGLHRVQVWFEKFRNKDDSFVDEESL